MANNNGTTPATHISEKDWLVTLLLCLFCGGLGVHRYYVGCSACSAAAWVYTATMWVRSARVFCTP